MTQIRPDSAEQQNDPAEGESTQIREESTSDKANEEKLESKTPSPQSGHHYENNRSFDNAQATLGDAGNIQSTSTGHTYMNNVAEGNSRAHLGNMDAETAKAFWGK
ncbi:hypothetical protein Q7P37_003282 [Cladosporium fusiforme]